MEESKEPVGNDGDAFVSSFARQYEVAVRRNRSIPDSLSVSPRRRGATTVRESVLCLADQPHEPHLFDVGGDDVFTCPGITPEERPGWVKAGVGMHETDEAKRVPLLADGSTPTPRQVALGEDLLTLVREHVETGNAWCSCGWRRFDASHAEHLAAVLGQRAIGVKPRA